MVWRRILDAWYSTNLKPMCLDSQLGGVWEIKEGNFPSKKSLILLVCTSISDIPWFFCFYIEESILRERKGQTKITEEKIHPINYNDHCSGFLRSGEGGSDNLVEQHLPNLPVQNFSITQKKKKKKHAHAHPVTTQTNNNYDDDEYKVRSFTIFFSYKEVCFQHITRLFGQDLALAELNIVCEREAATTKTCRTITIISQHTRRTWVYPF